MEQEEVLVIEDKFKDTLNQVNVTFGKNLSIYRVDSFQTFNTFLDGFQKEVGRGTKFKPRGKQLETDKILGGQLKK